MEARELVERIRPQVEQAREQIQRADATLRRWAHERPATCIAVALGAGFLVGRAVSRFR